MVDISTGGPRVCTMSCVGNKRRGTFMVSLRCGKGENFSAASSTWATVGGSPAKISSSGVAGMGWVQQMFPAASYMPVVDKAFLHCWTIQGSLKLINWSGFVSCISKGPTA